MKKVKTWLLILGLAGPSVVNLSCLSSLSNELWNAALNGATTAVETTVSTLVGNAIGGFGG